MNSKKLGSSCPRPLSSTENQSEASEPQPFLTDRMTPWEEFYCHQNERLSRIAAKMGVPPDQIADVVQEVWLAAIEHQQEFRGENAKQRLCSWLVSVVRKKSTDTIRRLSRLRRSRIESLDNLPAEPGDKKAKEPAEIREAKEQDETLAAQLEKLRKKNPRNRHLVCEHVLEGRSFPDLAAETGLSVHAISCRIGRTLSELGRRLQE